MNIDLFARIAARYLRQPVLGDVLDGLAMWLAAQGLQSARICLLVRKAPVLETTVTTLGVRSRRALSRDPLLSLAPRPARGPWGPSALV